MLQNSKSVNERAEVFYAAAKRDIFDDVIKPIEKEIEKLEAKVFDLSDFSLETDINKAMKRLTQEDCVNRFKELIEVKYAISMAKLKLKLKTDTYKELFS